MALTGLFAGAAQNRSETFRKRTPHYSIKTDISREFAEVIADHMEEIFKEYSRRFERYGRMREPFDVAVYKREEQYLRVIPPEVRGSTGVFSADDQLLAAHADGRTAEEVFRTLYHEGFHQFMHFVVSRDCPAWLNEGLAEYFSEATWNGQGFTTGQVPTMRLHTVQRAIREGTRIPLRNLCRMGRDQWIQNVRTGDWRRADLYYSQSWSVVHFLIHADNGRYAGILDQFLEELSDREDVEGAFRASFGTDMKAFEKAWANYVMSLRPSAKFRCRDNMEALMLLAQMVYKHSREFESVSDLRRQVLEQGRHRWEIARPTGEKVTSDQSEEVAKQFRCPYGQQGDGISYILVRHLGTHTVMLVCNHHPGIIIKAYYYRGASGTLKIRVEEQVRETVPEDLRRAIAAGQVLAKDVPAHE